MPVPRAAVSGLFLLAWLLMPSIGQADEIMAIQQQVKQGNTDAALKRVNAYLNSSPQDLRALFTKGLILAEQKRTEDAIRIFTEITKKYPHLPEPYNNLAVLYANQGQYDKAKLALQDALKTNPSYATAHENLGDIYAQMASEAYDKALQLNSNDRSRTKLELISEIARPAEKPIVIAAKSVEADKKLRDKPAIPKTSTSTSPIRPAESLKVPEIKTPETKAPETKQPTKQIEIRQPDAKPVTPAAEPEKAKTITMAKPAIETKPASENADENAKQQIATTVQQWTKAWSAQDVKKYLANYADDFEPADGESRNAWEQTRRDRVSSPASIRVDLSNLKVELEDKTTARVKFRQAYRTGRATMRTDKILIMKKTDAKWLIQQERTDR